MRVYVLIREDIDGHGGTYQTVHDVTYSETRAQKWESSSEIHRQWYEPFTLKDYRR